MANDKKPLYQQCKELRDKGLSYNEITKKLNLNPGDVSSLLLYGKNKEKPEYIEKTKLWKANWQKGNKDKYYPALAKSFIKICLKRNFFTKESIIDWIKNTNPEIDGRLTSDRDKRTIGNATEPTQQPENVV